MGIQKRLIVKTLNVVVADGVLEMSAKQRGELLKLVQEMGDIDIHSSEVLILILLVLILILLVLHHIAYGYSCSCIQHTLD